MNDSQVLALVTTIISMGGALVWVVRMLVSQIIKRDSAAVAFQNEIIEQLRRDRAEDRVIQQRIVVTQDKIMDRLEALERRICECK